MKLREYSIAIVAWAIWLINATALAGPVSDNNINVQWSGFLILCLGVLIGYRHKPFFWLLIPLLFLNAVFQAQVDYKVSQVANLENASELREFEVLGRSQLFAGKYSTWIAIQPRTDQAFLAVGRLQSDDPLTTAATYEGVLRIDPMHELAERSLFQANLRSAPTLVALASSADDFVVQLRSSYLSNLRGVSSDSAALVAGLAIGERSLVSQNLVEQMRTLSLSHLVAVSGANLAIVAGAAYLILMSLRTPRALRTLGAALVILLYVQLVGPEPSVLRAALMALIVLFAVQIGRGSQALNALAIAVIILINFDPWIALDFGFALSVFATMGLLTLAPKLYRSWSARIPKWLAASLAVAASAQLYTTPILLMLSDELPVFSVLANLLAEPVVAPVTVLGIAAVLTGIVLPWGTQALTFLASIGTLWIEFLAGTLSVIPGSSLFWLPAPWSAVMAGLILASIALWVATTLKRWIVIATLLLVVSVGWSLTTHLRYLTWPDSKWQVVACDVGQGDALLMRSADAVALIDVGREPELLSACLKSANVSRIDLLVLTHFDADHVGSIETLLTEVQVERALIHGFPDSRPLAILSRQSLQEHGVLTELAQAGLRFDFGNGSLVVLAPSLTGREASDSNDASIVVAASFDGIAVLALGDLGEEGQERLLSKQAGVLNWLSRQKLILKVSHHGSADQSAQLTRLINPDVSLVSAGLKNSYGHPTDKTLSLLVSSGSRVFRTDLLGSIAVSFHDAFNISVGGKL